MPTGHGHPGDFPVVGGVYMESSGLSSPTQTGSLTKVRVTNTGRKLRTTESTRSCPSPKHLFFLLADSKHSLVLRAPDPDSSDPHPHGDMPLSTSPPHWLLLFPRNLFVQQAMASQAPSFLTAPPNKPAEHPFHTEGFLPILKENRVGMIKFTKPRGGMPRPSSAVL